MSRKIIVLGNCQVGGLAAAMQRIYWADEVRAVPLNAGKTDRGPAFFRQIGDADLVFGSAALRAQLAERNALPARFFTVPAVNFGAFHPDLIRASTHSGNRKGYHSAIAVWAFNRGLDPAAARKLFTYDTFEALGYFSRWDLSTEQLRARFDEAQIEFDRFFLAVKRLGTFMHTLNHPYAVVLAYLAKTLAIAAGHDGSIWTRDLQVMDALGRQESWGVYPDVARELAVPGSYSWLVDKGTLIEGLENYLDYAWQKYAEAGIQPGQLRMHGVKVPAYDAILSSALERA